MAKKKFDLNKVAHETRSKYKRTSISKSKKPKFSSMNKSKNLRNKEILNFIFEILELFFCEFDMENLSKKLKNDINFKKYLSNINSTFPLNPVKVSKKNIMDLL